VSIWDKPEKVVRWLEDGIEAGFFSHVKELYDRAYHKLRSSNDAAVIHRMQGELDAYDSILGLHEEVKRFLKDKRDGKVK